ncbi:hypothetical protein LINPERPRIM_LOCUS32622, partial [Linum perenne]
PSRHNPKSRSSTKSSNRLWRERSGSQLAWTKQRSYIWSSLDRSKGYGRY